MDEIECPECHGSRLKKEAMYFRIHEKNIFELSTMDISDLSAWFDELSQHLSDKQTIIASEIVKEIKDRLDFLMNVGLNYLALSRSSKSLSGGEAQRIKLASFLVKGVTKEKALFVFDEPTTGLHFHDIQKLLASFEALIDKGHSIIVIEHNLELIK